MSYTELYRITLGGRIREYAEFQNSWRGAMLVWCNLYKKYLPERVQATRRRLMLDEDPVGPINDDDYKALWPLFKDRRLSECERAVLGSTYDRVVLEKRHFQRFYDDVQKYAGMHEAGTLIDQAQSILTLRRKECLGVCWNQTTVGDSWHEGNIHKVEGGPWSLYREIDREKS